MHFTYPVKPLTIACFSDLHIDSPSHCRAELLRDLEEAKKKRARIFINGDVWDAIFPRDKRFSGAQGMGKIDALVDYAVDMAFELLKPYANNIDFIGAGNHERTVVKYCYTDPVNNLIGRLNGIRSKQRNPIRHGGYSGFLTISFRDKKHSIREVWYYHHGKGGSAPVTKGAIDLYRVRAGNVADVYWLGHKHTNMGDIPRVRRVTHRGDLIAKPVFAFFTAGYQGKQEENNFEEKGYLINWGEESFYELNSVGNALINYIPKYNHKGNILLKKNIVKSVDVVT